jgi:hypothetical protein
MKGNLHQDEHLGSMDVDFETILSLSSCSQIFFIHLLENAANVTLWTSKPIHFSNSAAYTGLSEPKKSSV